MKEVIRYFQPGLNVFEEKFLFYVFKKLRKENILSDTPIYSLQKKKSEIDKGFGELLNSTRRGKGKSKTNKKETTHSVKKMRGEVQERLLNLWWALEEGDNEDGKIISKQLPKMIIPVFDKIKITSNLIELKISKPFADYFLYISFPEALAGVSEGEVINGRSKYTPRLERILKRSVDKEKEVQTIHIPLSTFRNAMLSNPKKEYREQEKFERVVVKKAIKELEEFSKFSNIEFTIDTNAGNGVGRVSFTYSLKGNDVQDYNENVIEKQKEKTTPKESESIK